MTQCENDPHGRDPREAALAPLGQPAANRALDLLQAPSFAGWIPATAVAEIRRTAPDLDGALLAAARTFARPAISGYRVGALLETTRGDLALGCNLEIANAPLSAGVHAEQSAAAIALLHGTNAFRRITVTAPPCGHCRQFLLEFPHADALEVRVEGNPCAPLRALLPAPFEPSHLGQHRTPRPLDGPWPATHEALAKWAFERSHAPYAGPGTGICVTAAGQDFIGATVQSAAFHPTLPALQMALVAMTLRGVPFAEIESVVLVESADGPSAEVGVAKLLLTELAPTAVLRMARNAP